MGFIDDLMSNNYQYNVLDALNYAIKNGCLRANYKQLLGKFIIENNLKYNNNLVNTIYEIVENCVKYHVYDAYDAHIAICKAIGYY